MARATIWPTSAQDLHFRGGFVSETPEMTTFWGGTQFLGEGGVKGVQLKGSHVFHVLEPRNVILAAVWRHVSGFTFRTPRFGTWCPKRSRFRRQLRFYHLYRLMPFVGPKKQGLEN